jgi:hypothetical protein
MVDPDGTVGKAARIVWGGRFGAAGRDEVVANVAVAIAEDVEVGEGRGSGLDSPRYRALEDAHRHSPKGSAHVVSPFSELGVIGSSFRATGNVPGGAEFAGALNFVSEDENVLPCRDVQGKRMFKDSNARGQIPLAALV